MIYLLDTDWVIDCLTGQEAARQLLPNLLPIGVAISVIVYSEIYEGIYTSRDPKQAEATFQSFLEGLTILDITRPIAERNAQIRSYLRSQRRPIDNRVMDILIAATAITHDLTLITRNIRDYQDIPDLKLYQFSLSLSILVSHPGLYINLNMPYSLLSRAYLFFGIFLV